MTKRLLMITSMLAGFCVAWTHSAEAQQPAVIIDPSPKISGVATDVPAFIGFTAKAGRKLVNNPVRVSSMREFERVFGGGEPGALEVDVDESGGSIAVVVNAPAVPNHFLYYSLQLYFANGGGPCWVVSVGDYGTAFTTGRFLAALKALEKKDEVTLIVAPDAVLGNGAQAADIADAALAQARTLGDRFVIMDVWNAQPGGVDDIAKVKTSFRSAITNETSLRRHGAAYYPYLNTSIPIAYDEKMVTVASHTGSSGSVIPSGTSIRDKTVLKDRRDIHRKITEALDQTFVRIPASGGVAGVYVATDNKQGVWKAPANVSLSRVSGPAVDVDASFNEALNVDGSSGKSVNAIRAMSGKGTLIWGARTLDGNSNEYRYVPVARLMTMIDESLAKGLEWVAFEPNNAASWTRAKTITEDFLNDLFRNGAFPGRTQKEAYFVKVGLGETMSSADVSNGRLIVEVGVAPLRPAEFIVLRIEKKTAHL